MLGGYTGKILNVDLSTGKSIDEMPDEELYRDFLGGCGIGARILFTRQKAGIDPLGQNSILGFVTGALTGTPALTGCRYTVVAKSPLTGTWGDANCGGDFGPHLKFAGYDAVFFTGISERPVYLFVHDGRPQLRDATHLWGKDTSETEDSLKRELGEAVRVASIGPAAEKLSLISGIINNKGRAAARSGLGAVMGSKKLKAVAVIGTRPVSLAAESKANRLRREYLSRLKGPVADWLSEFGTSAFTLSSLKSGDAPVKNWGGIAARDFPDPEAIDGANVKDLQQRKYGCWRCPVVCGGQMKAGKKYRYAAGVHKPEYETLCAFGSMCLNNNLESIVMANDICNRYGLDTISAGAVIAFAMECYANGILTLQDTDGVELTWGNHRAIVTMTEKLAKREGFGDILADGVKVAAEKIGGDAEKFAVHVGGQELAMHDPRHAPSYATVYKLDPTPGRHTQGGAHWMELGLPFEGLDTPSVANKYVYSGKGQAHRILSIFDHVLDASGTCLFMGWCVGATHILEFVNAVTGHPYTMKDLLEIGDRICNLRQAFNIREGVNPLRFKMPDRVLGRPALTGGPLAGVTIDEEAQLKDYLAAMDWDLATAKPSRAKLQQLGLNDVVAQLWPV